jgi:hypothetical protein
VIAILAGGVVASLRARRNHPPATPLEGERDVAAVP